MREVAVSIWCDVCADDDRRVPAVTFTIGADGKWQTLELCDEHRDALLVPLLRLLASHGAPADDAPATRPRPPRPTAETAVRRGRLPKENGPRSQPCLVDGTSYVSPTSLVQHYRSTHRVTIPGGLFELYGLRCPACGVTVPDARSQHFKNEHGAKVAELWRRLYLERSDPVGIVRPVVETLGGEW